MEQLELERQAAIEAQMEHDRRLGLEEEAAQEYKRRLNQRDARKVIEHQMLEKERQKFFQGEEVRAAPVPCSLFTRAAPLPPPPPPLSAWCMVHGGTYTWLIMGGDVQEARRDKAMVDGIVAKIIAEDRQEAEDKRRRQAESQKFINDFKEQQAAWKKAIADAEAEEERKIMEYARAKEAREAATAAKKAEADAEAAAVYARLSREQAERQRQLDEEENLRMLLAEEETEARLEREEMAVRRVVRVLVAWCLVACCRCRRACADCARALCHCLLHQRRAKKAADLKAMMDANAAQTELKEWRAQKQREEEAEQRRQLKIKYEEDERAEREAARRRAQAKVEYMNSVERQKQQTQEMFELQRQAELQQAQADKLKEDYRARVVEEARRKLLMEHAAALQGYLPKGVLRSKEDLELVRRAGAGNGAGRGYRR